MKSTFQLTVPQAFYDLVCEECDQEFADCYLYGARLVGKILTPRTLTGAIMMMRDSRFIFLAKNMEITVSRPTPYPGEGDRLSAKQARESLEWA